MPARMISTLVLAISAIVLVSIPGAICARTSFTKPTSVLDFTMKDIDGKEVPLAKFQGKVLLIVNTASQCGNTPQYKGLQEIYQKYKDQGFEVLAFPANEFGAQEPGSDDQIKQFCTSTYKVSFPLFSKIVVKGKGIHPLYEYLTSAATDPQHAGPITWNFAKFLINRKGEVVARFDPGVKPESANLTGAVEKASPKSSWLVQDLCERPANSRPPILRVVRHSPGLHDEHTVHHDRGGTNSTAGPASFPTFASAGRLGLS